MISSQLRKLPSVTTLLAEAARQGVFDADSESSRTELVRAAIDDARCKVQAGAAAPELSALIADLRRRRRAGNDRMIRRVINATGIPLHTNLGRAPLPRAVLDKVVELGTGYCSLELDLATGQRGKRGDAVTSLLKTITGAEAVVVVNNGAAAVFLTLAALARGREVIVSRGELVQIGGGFRVPDILAASGAKLVEVGTTNITTVADYERAVTADTAMILRIHRSNFFVSGHTAAPSLSALSAFARGRGLPLLHDLGSGSFVRWSGHDIENEPLVQDSLRAGSDLVTFSGDKLLGGPQAGFVVGKTELVTALGAHPLYRALRVGRLTMVALQEVLRYYMRGQHRSLPVWTMLEMSVAEHERRSQDLAERLRARGVACEIVAAEGAVGGGAAPQKSLPTQVVRIQAADVSAVLSKLRRNEPAVIPRVERDAVLVDVRAVMVEEFDGLVDGLVKAMQEN